MAIAFTEINNIDIGEIIGTLVLDYSKTPNETYRGKNLELSNCLGTITLWDPDTRYKNVFDGTELCVEKSQGSDGITEVNVFHQGYKCGVSGDFCQKKDMCIVGEELAISTYKTSCGYYPVNVSIPMLDKITRVPVIKMPSNIHMHKNEVCYVFNIQDKYPLALLALLMNVNRTGTASLASEIIVEGVVPYMGGTIKSEDKIVFDKPYEHLRCEYNGELPKLMSKPQVRKLYDLGIVKMATIELHTLNFLIMSDDAFDNDPDKSLESMFGNKEAMHKYIKEMLEKTLGKTL
jgi:hypothetical protein